MHDFLHYSCPWKHLDIHLRIIIDHRVLERVCGVVRQAADQQLASMVAVRDSLQAVPETTKTQRDFRIDCTLH